MRTIAVLLGLLAVTDLSVAQGSQPEGDVTGAPRVVSVTSAPARKPVAPVTLSHGQKFKLFVVNSVAPGNFLGAAVEAGLSQRDHDNLGFGQGAAGFGGRFGAAVADRTTFNLLALYALPAALKLEPRYLPQREGGFKSRAWKAAASPFVAKRDSGGSTFNTPVVVGAFASGGLSNAYYPERERGAIFTLRSASLTVGSVALNNIVREFWPDIKRKLLRRAQK